MPKRREEHGWENPDRKERAEVAPRETPSSGPPSDYTFSVQPDVDTDLDPQLQKLILQRRAGEELSPILMHESADVSAPGDRIKAAASRSGGVGTVLKSGTSMAAPHVTGLVALLMQAAGRTLTTAEIRQAVIDHVRREPPAGGDWDPRYGHGRVDAVAARAPFSPSRPRTPRPTCPRWR